MEAVRPYSVGGELRTDFGSLDHPTMKAMLDRGDPRTISAMASTWEAAGSRISEQAAGFEDGLAALRQRWQGPAADAYIAKMDGLAATLRGTAEACFRTRGALGAAAEALTAAKQQMPAPSAGNDGHSHAVTVMRQLSDRYLTAQAAIPAPPGYSGPEVPSVAGGTGHQPAVAFAATGSVGVTSGVAPGTLPGSAPPGGHVMLVAAVAPGHPGAVPVHPGAVPGQPGAAPVAPTSPAGSSPPGAMLPGAPGGGAVGAVGVAGMAGVGGVSGGATGAMTAAATGAGTGAAAGPAGGTAAPGAAIPGMPLFPAGGPVSGTAAATRPSGQRGSGAGSLFAEERKTGASGLPPGGVIDAHPAGPAGAQPTDDVGRSPVPAHQPVTPPDGATVTAVPTWLTESEDVWGTGPTAPPVLGVQKLTELREPTRKTP